MAETFLLNIAEVVLLKITSEALREVSLAWGLESSIEKLEEVLSAVKAVLLDAEQQQEQNLKMKSWLGKLREVLYDSEDVLDEFECKALRKRAMKHRRRSSSGSSRKVRLSGFFSSTIPLAFRFRIAHKIKKIRDRIVQISALKSSFDLSQRNNVVHRKREMTHSFVHALDVLGREKDKENIIQHLMLPVHCENVSVIPIVGIGGLGKTTLAKFVCNDATVVQHFQLKIWVSVSKDFDLQQLLVQIIKSSTGQNMNNLDLDQLQQVLRQTLNGRKYLLVLDDVWNDDPKKWFELKSLLLVGARGSKIVVTTRSNQVASIMGSVPTYNLADLSYENCLSLFFKCAFRQGEEKQYPHLVKIGREIVKKCKGVPLAVMTLGTLLHSKTDEREWKHIRDNGIWRLEQKENDILPALRLSYEHLPSFLKRCFAYCSIFPKGYEFIDIVLVHFWMAHGLLQPFYENQALEDVGFSYLKELGSRCFLQDFREHYGFVHCKMHDLMHDLAISVAQSEYSIVTSHSHRLPKSVRHLSFPDPQSLPRDLSVLFHSPKHARTISFRNERGGYRSRLLMKTCFSVLKYLRVLDLADSQFEELPRKISTLKHLRYLNLAFNQRIRKLPNSICKLQSLQSLILVGCVEIEELPRDLRHMISLRFLWITTKQKCLPRNGIGCLNSLRYLFISHCKNLQHLCEDMQGLASLRRLLIDGCDSLTCLPQTMKHLTALETLIIGNGLISLPQWLLRASGNNLHFLKIESCPSLRELPKCLQNLPSIQELWIENCPQLRERCQVEIGEDWAKIAHIPKILIDGVDIKSRAN